MAKTKKAKPTGKVFKCPKCGELITSVNGYNEARTKVLIDSKGKVKAWLQETTYLLDASNTSDFECPECGENITEFIKE